MKVVKHELEDGYVSVKADASPAEVTHAFAMALESFAFQMGVMLEPGKPAAEQIKQKLNVPDPESIVKQQAELNLVPFAVDKSGVQPAFDPRPELKGTIENGKPFSFELRILPKPSYELTSYDPVNITVPTFYVPQEEVDFQMQSLADSFTEYVSDDPHPVEQGDTMLLSLEALIDGKRNASLSASKRAYQVGAGLMPPAFDENILGMNVGETKTFTIEMPAGMGDYSGKPLECTVGILEMQKAVVPEIDDEFVAKNLPFYKDAAALRTAMEERMAKDLGRNYEELKANLATTEIAQRFEGNIADAIYENMHRTMVDNLRTQVLSEGIDFDEFVEQQGGSEQFGMAMMMQTRQALVEGYSLDAVFRHAKLELEDEDIDRACKTMNPQDPAGMRRNMEKSGYGYSLRETAERMKAQRYLVEHAEVTIDDSLPLY